MAGLGEVARQVAEMDEPGTLRFGECITQGRRAYQWAQAIAGSPLVVRYLCACWNHRREIAAAFAEKVDG